jgi:predicted nucleotidyltransferase
MPISREIERIAETIRQAVPAEKIYLFGSYAYGKPHKDSDYDICDYTRGHHAPH